MRPTVSTEQKKRPGVMIEFEMYQTVIHTIQIALTPRLRRGRMPSTMSLPMNIPYAPCYWGPQLHMGLEQKGPAIKTPHSAAMSVEGTARQILEHNKANSGRERMLFSQSIDIVMLREVGGLQCCGHLSCLKQRLKVFHSQPQIPFASEHL